MHRNIIETYTVTHVLRGHDLWDNEKSGLLRQMTS